jgi:hypothetical protein
MEFNSGLKGLKIGIYIYIDVKNHGKFSNRTNFIRLIKFVVVDGNTYSI